MRRRRTVYASGVGHGWTLSEGDNDAQLHLSRLVQVVDPQPRSCSNSQGCLFQRQQPQPVHHTSSIPLSTSTPQAKSTTTTHAASTHMHSALLQPQLIVFTYPLSSEAWRQALPAVLLKSLAGRTASNDTCLTGAAYSCLLSNPSACTEHAATPANSQHFHRSPATVSAQSHSGRSNACSTPAQLLPCASG